MISDGVHAVLESTGEYGKFYQYLTDILMAIKNTSTIYYRRDNGKTSESGFATEFLHQLRCFSDCKCKLGNRLYEGLIINGETTKMKEGYLLAIVRRTGPGDIAVSAEHYERCGNAPHIFLCLCSMQLLLALL